MKYEKTAKRLVSALERRGINQQTLADMSGVSKHSISQYVNGYHAPSNISASKMSPILGVNPMWLMGYDVQMNSNLTNDEYNKIIENIGPENMQRLKEITEDNVAVGLMSAEEFEISRIIDAYKSADKKIKKAIRILLEVDK